VERVDPKKRNQGRKKVVDLTSAREISDSGAKFRKGFKKESERTLKGIPQR